MVTYHTWLPKERETRKHAKLRERFYVTYAPTNVHTQILLYIPNKKHLPAQNSTGRGWLCFYVYRVKPRRIIGIHRLKHPSQSMSRVDELPDHLDKALNLNAACPPKLPSSSSVPFPIKPKPQHNHGPTPALPPHMESVRSHTADDIVRMMNRTPLFMTSLEGSEGDDGTQPT